MRQQWTQMIFLSIAVLVFSGMQSPHRIYKDEFSVEIWQNGQQLSLNGDTCQLEKDTFQIRLYLKGLEGIFVNASLNPDFYHLKDGEFINNFESITSRTMAETNFNEDLELLVHNANVSYWFYDPNMNWHRFDKDVETTGSCIIGKQTVNYLNLLKYDGKNSQIKEVGQMNRPVYLYLFTLDESGKKPREKERAKLVLMWKPGE